MNKCMNCGKDCKYTFCSDECMGKQMEKETGRMKSQREKSMLNSEGWGRRKAGIEVLSVPINLRNFSDSGVC